MKKRRILSIFLISCMLSISACGPAEDAGIDVSKAPVSEASVSEEIPSYEGYTLEQVVLLSRHNIRSPLSGKDSLLGKVTDHEWFEWTSAPSELSVRGGILETEMGQFYRKWMESEGLFTENYHPEDGEVRIYANSKQRTIATAQFFSSALLPTGGVDVEYHAEFDQMDPVFNPQLTFDSEKYSEAAEDEIRKLYEDDMESLSDNYELVTDVIDMEDTESFKDGSVEKLSVDDTEFVLEENAEPGMSGSLKTACSISDALVLQYYEEPDTKAAAFGNDLKEGQWEDISEIKDVYVDVLFGAPLIAANVAHPLLMEIDSELKQDGRKFTFLCGHDSNVESVLAALDVEEYSLPDTIEKKTPIGCKLMFSKYRADDGGEYMSVDLVYQTTEQLRDMSILDMNDPPAIYPLEFEGIDRNPDGLYEADEFLNRLEDAIGEYDSIRETYGQGAGMDDSDGKAGSDEDMGAKDARHKVIIDTDTGADDSAALILAASAPDIDIIGVTTLVGNVGLSQSTKNALAALEIAGCDAPVYKGSKDTYNGRHVAAFSVFGEDGMGDAGLVHPEGKARKKDAVSFILDTVRKNPGEIEIVSLGPATNIAKAMEKDPDTMKKVKRIWSMGTAGQGPGNASPVAEFNVYHDAEAYRAMLDFGVPVTVVGLDVCDGEALWTGAQFGELKDTGETGAFVAVSFRKIREFYSNNGYGDTVMNCDPVAMMCLACPDFVQESIPAHGSCVIEEGESYAQVIFYKEGFTYDVVEIY